MKAQELRNALSLSMDEFEIDRNLKNYSHWMKVLFTNRNFETTQEKEQRALQKLEKLKLVKLKTKDGKTKVEITKSGKELYVDFLHHGYF